MKSSRLFLLGCYAFLSLGVSMSVIGPGLATLAQHAQIPLEQAGGIFSGLSVGFLLSGALINAITARIGVRGLLIVSPLLSIACQLTVGLSGSFVLQLVGALGFGLGQAGTQVAYNTMFGSGAEGSKHLNQINAFYGIGSLIGPLVAALGYSQLGTATPAFLVGALMTTPLVLGAILYKDGRAVPAGSRIPEDRAPLRTGLMWLMIAAMGLYVGAEVAFSGWAAEYVKRGAGISLAQASATVSLFWLGFSVSRYFSDRISRAISRQDFVLATLGITIAGLLGMIVFRASLVPLLICATLVGYGLGPVYPTMVALGIRRFPKNATLVASGLTSAGSIGAIFLPALTGPVLDQSGLAPAWLIQVGTLTVTAGVWWLIKREMDKTLK